LFYILQGLRDQFEPKEAAAAEAWMKIADDQSNYLIFSRFVHTSKNILIKNVNRGCKLKDRQYNGQKKKQKVKQRSTKH
jgi:hypothetical protein